MSWRVLDPLSGLVDKSLVVAEASPLDAGARRYRMLEPVRHFAREKLRESGEGAKVRRQVANVLAKLEASSRAAAQAGRLGLL